MVVWFIFMIAAASASNRTGMTYFFWLTKAPKSPRLFALSVNIDGVAAKAYVPYTFFSVLKGFA